jgi:hypothetical protein
VEGSPYFILVGGASGQIDGEGTAGTWDQVVSLLRDAVTDLGFEEGRNRPGSSAAEWSDGSALRILRADRELAAAGIGPGHPSLWSGTDPAPDEAGGAG